MLFWYSRKTAGKCIGCSFRAAVETAVFLAYWTQPCLFGFWVLPYIFLLVFTVKHDQSKWLAFLFVKVTTYSWYHFSSDTETKKHQRLDDDDDANMWVVSYIMFS